jgi:predicted 3-demethylubiquinone-9 3-methyltransferase (glyoxalase superfamily)
MRVAEMQKITTFLWFQDKCEEAMQFYVSVFKNAPVQKGESKIVSIGRFPDGPLEGPMKGLEGKVAQGVFMLAGQQFMAFDGGPEFKFNEAISLFVECESQEEVDYYWEKLRDDGTAEACGWLRDKYGVSWQIIPTAMGEMLGDPDPEKSGRAMKAMLQMKKIDIAELRRAHEGK